MPNIPNTLTSIRLLLIPFCGILIFNGMYNQAAIIFIIASLTDVIDGYIARKYNLVTNFGKFFDPLADKLLSVTTLTMLSYKQRIHWIIPLLIFIKELLIGSGGLVMYKKKRLVKSAGWYGKVSTVLFFISILFLMFDITHRIGAVLIVLALACSYFALIMYIRVFTKACTVKTKDTKS